MSGNVITNTLRRTVGKNGAAPHFAHCGIEYVNKGLLVTDTEVWFYIHLHDNHIPYTTDEEKFQFLCQVEQIFRNVSDTLKDDYDIMLLGLESRIDANKWEKEHLDRVPVDPVTGDSLHTPALAPLMAESKKRVAVQVREEAYLGVRLAVRSMGFNPLNWVSSVRSSVLEVCGEEPIPYSSDLRKWSEEATSLMTVLSNYGRPATNDELAWVIAKPFNPAIDFTLSEHALEQGKKYLNTRDIIRLRNSTILTNTPGAKGVVTVVQEDPVTGYEYSGSSIIGVVTPQDEPFDALARQLPVLLGQRVPFSVEWCIRGTVRHKDSVRREVSSKAINLRGNAKEFAAAAGNSDGVLDEFDADEIRGAYRKILFRKKETLSERGAVDFTGYIAVKVTAPTVEAVKANYRQLVDTLSGNLKITTYQGEQDHLLLSFSPGSPAWGRKSDYPILDISAIAALGIGVSGTVGDSEPDRIGGLYVGYTTHLVRRPIFFDPNLNIENDGAPVYVVCGQSGKGKTMFSLDIAYQCAARGRHVIIIDPKIEAEGVALDPLMAGAQLVPMADAAPGTLNPFRTPCGYTGLREKKAQEQLAKDVLETLLGRVLTPQNRPVLSRAFTILAEQVPDPYLGALIPLLRELGKRIPGWHEHSETLASTLEDLLRSEYSDLLMASGANVEPLRASGLTVFTLFGLTLPDSTEIRTSAEAVGAAVLSVLVAYSVGMMTSLPREDPKLIIIDEAHAILRTPTGEQLLTKLARLGRTWNTAMGLVTQNVTDITRTYGDENGICAQVHTWLFFGQTDKSQIEEIRRILELPTSIDLSFIAKFGENLDANGKKIKGEFIMRDSRQRVQKGRVELPWDRLFLAADSNPRTADESRRRLLSGVV